MGLEGVELVMDVEDRFCTSFPDAELEHMQTVGDLHTFIMERIRSQHSSVSTSAAMFDSIRKILVEQFNVDRAKVQRSTRLDSLVEAGSREQFRRSIESALATKIPRLKRLKWLQWNGDGFPPECSTVTQLVDQCVNLNKITNEFGPNDDDAVFEIVRKLVAGIASVDETKISHDTNFVYDLGF
ncbi:MAG: hypothetical protein ACR2N1_15560 [Rubripirellula sp.]